MKPDRIMLGNKESPELLVISSAYTQDCVEFEFYVINGCWHGKFTNGYISIFGCPTGDVTNIDCKLGILSTDQNRLRGDYQDVFDNFSNEFYIAPLDKPAAYFDIDDIAF